MHSIEIKHNEKWSEREKEREREKDKLCACMRVCERERGRSDRDLTNCRAAAK
jgi:hypothetical protein